MKKQNPSAEELGKLIGKLLAGTADPKETAELEEWFQSQEDMPAVVESPLQKDAYREQLFLKTLGKLEIHTPQKSIHRISSYWKVAASFLAFTLVSYLVYFLVSSQNQQENYISYTGSSGERKEIILPDSSRVFLNGEGELLVSEDFNRDRKVTLEGEAFFQVTKNPYRPFQISTSQLTTTVLGTSFSINAPKDLPGKVAVKSGKVQVSSKINNSEIILVKGQQSVWENGDLEIAQINDQDQEFGWIEGKLVFRNESLQEIAEKLENWYGIEVTVETVHPSDCKITGTYSRLNLEELMELIQYTININYTINGKNLIIKSTGC